MRKNQNSYLKIIEFSHWGNCSTFWKCKCFCGKILAIDRRRIKSKSRCYKSCGCIKDINSKTYYISTRRSFFNRIEKKDGHWIYQTKSKQKIINTGFKNKQMSIQRLAYIFWNHLKEIDKSIRVISACGVRECVCPWHLSIMTASEHLKYGYINGRKKRGKDKKLRNIQNYKRKCTNQLDSSESSN